MSKRRNLILHVLVMPLLLLAVPHAPAKPAGSLVTDIDRQIRGGHLGSAAGDGGVLPKMRQAGMNSIFVPIKSHVAEERMATLERWQELTAAHGINLFPLVSPYRPGDRAAWPLQRRYTDLSGVSHTTPCPNDALFWQRKITDAYVEIARWAKDQENVPGILLDAVMYGADQTVYQDACFCEECREELAAELRVDPASLDLTAPADLARYRVASEELVRRSTIETRRRTHEVFPGCILGGYVLDYDAPFYRGLLRAWGTPERPVLVGTERTYGRGGAEDFELRKERVADWGAHADMLPGLYGISRIPAENVAEQLYHFARSDRGYFLYDLIALSDGAGTSHVLPGGGPPAYWQAIAQANEELDQWLVSDGAYESGLKIRSFSPPAPGIALDAWKRLDLPQRSGPAPEAAFMQRQGQGLFYMAVAAGDEVRVPVHVDPIDPREPDAVGLVVVDPTGVVVFDAKMTGAGTELVQFVAKKRGTYCLIAKSIRYAFQVGGSSHGWIADAPLGASMALYEPRELFLQPKAGAQRILLGASVAGPAEGVRITVRTLEGRVLAERTVDDLERRELEVSLASPDSQPLHITFANAPGGAVEDVMFSILEGAIPFVAASADAPFPTE